MRLMKPFLLFLSLSNSAWALVDYTEPVSKRPIGVQSPAASTPDDTSQIKSKAAPRSFASRSSNMAHINFGVGHESLDVSRADEDGKVGITHIHAHFQTNYDLFLSASYWSATTDDAFVTDQTASQSGNAAAIIGFNWLKFGNHQDLATIDLYAGHSFRAKSDLGSSRNDIITGVETSKRFHDFFLGLGYEYRMTGTPDNPKEADIGTIQKLSASLGWRATPDIQFILEGASVRVSPAKDSGHQSILQEELSFASITPKIGLGLRPYFQLELGARFQTQDVEDKQALYQTRLWDMGEAYGNSIFAGLNISI